MTLYDYLKEPIIAFLIIRLLTFFTSNLCILLGYWLYKLRFLSKGNLTFKSKPAEVLLSGSGPGLFFMAFGVILLIVSLVSTGVKTESSYKDGQEKLTIELASLKNQLNKVENNIDLINEFKDDYKLASQLGKGNSKLEIASVLNKITKIENQVYLLNKDFKDISLTYKNEISQSKLELASITNKLMAIETELKNSDLVFANKIEYEEAKRQEEEAMKQREQEMARVKEGDIVPLADIEIKPIFTPKMEMSKLKISDPNIPDNIIGTILINENGEVSQVKILTKLQNEKSKLAIAEFLKTWKYQSPLKNNVKVKVWKSFALKISK